MKLLDQVFRAGHLAETVDADQVTWDAPYRDAVTAYVGDDTGAAALAMARPPQLPGGLRNMMARLGLGPGAAWRKAEDRVRDAAPVCVHCPDTEACARGCLPADATACPNFNGLCALKDLAITHRETPGRTACPAA